MVVMGLINFMDRSKYYNVQETNLRELAEEHRRLTDERPLLIIDGSIVSELIIQEPDQWIYGGQFRQFVRDVNEFVQRLEKLGIDVEYYFDGNIAEKTPSSHWGYHRINNMERAFVNIKEGCLPEAYLMKFPPRMASLICYALKYECSCTVFNTAENCYRQISRMARSSSRCFGILAKSSEYIIFDTKPLIYSPSLNINTMDVKVYHRDELVRVTRLQPDQLPALSCMLGNQMIPCHLLREFHYQLSYKYGSDYIFLANEVAKVIRRYWNRKGENIKDFASFTGISPGKLKVGLSWYDIEHPAENGNSRSHETLQVLRDKCVHLLVPPQLLAILSYHRYSEFASLEDPKDTSVPPSALIYRSLRRRMYTVISGGESMYVQEWCEYRNRNLRRPEVKKNLEFEFQGKLPTVVELFSDEASEHARWNVLIAVLAVTISISELKKIEAHFVTLCCLINHLMHFRGLELPVWEVKAFISQAVHPRASDPDFVSSLKVNKVQPRAVTLAGIFLTGVINVMNILGASGLPFPLTEAMPWKYFDGKLFHHCYNSLLGKPNPNDVILNLYENDMHAMNKFKHLYRVTIEGVARAEQETAIKEKTPPASSTIEADVKEEALPGEHVVAAAFTVEADVKEEALCMEHVVAAASTIQDGEDVKEEALPAEHVVAVASTVEANVKEEALCMEHVVAAASTVQDGEADVKEEALPVEHVVAAAFTVEDGETDVKEALPVVVAKNSVIELVK